MAYLSTTCDWTRCLPNKSGLLNHRPLSRITLRKGSHELRLDLEHSANNGVHTGGHLWISSCHVSQWLCDQQEMMHGARVIELGCGLGLPSLVAARLGASVLATDALDALLVKLGTNATANGCPRIETQVLDFAERADVERARPEGTRWDLVLFADCIHGGQGWSLPSALVLLLRGTPSARAIGAFSVAIRPGAERFWTEAAHVGLRWRELGRSASEGSRLYEFTCADDARARHDWGEHIDSAEAQNVGLNIHFRWD